MKFKLCLTGELLD